MPSCREKQMYRLQSSISSLNHLLDFHFQVFEFFWRLFIDLSRSKESQESRHIISLRRVPTNHWFYQIQFPCPSMNSEFIIKTLQSLSLTRNPSTVNLIQEFLDQEIGIPSDCQAELIYAAAGFLSEHGLIQITRGNSGSNKVDIESLMSLLKPAAINSFLRDLEIIGRKVRWTSLPLLWKIRNLPISYAMFARYEAVISELAVSITAPSAMSDLRAIIWLLFLWAKHSSQVEFDINQQTAILQASISLAVRKMVSESCLENLFKKYYPQKVMAVRSELEKLLFVFASHIMIRIGENPQELALVLAEETNRERFLAELRKTYQMMNFSSVKVNFIDESKFIQFAEQVSQPKPTYKTVTNPLNNKSSPESIENSGQASDTVDQAPKSFLSIPRPSSISPFIKRQIPLPLMLTPLRSHSNFTPITTNMTNCHWIIQRTALMNSQALQKLTNLFSLINDEHYQKVRGICREYIMRVVRMYNNDTKNITPRVEKIQQLYEYFVLWISKCYSEEENLNMLGNQTYLMNLLCLTTAIFFFSNSLQYGDFRVFAEQFDSHYLDVFRIINKMGKFDQTMPESIRQYLYKLEKTMMIVYIWEDGYGYQILTHKGELTIYQRALSDRFQKHLYDRIYEIHRALMLEQSQIERIKSIVAYILNQKPQLLKQNLLDQIIICSVFTVLRLHRQEISLEDVFKRYSTLELSFNSLKYEAYGKNNEKLTLLAFYNNIYKVQVEAAITDEYISHKFLATPIRQEIRQLIGGGQQPVSSILQHQPANSSFYHKNIIDWSVTKKESNTYGNRLLKKIIVLTPNKGSVKKIENVVEESGGSTPVFPILQLNARQFSFGLIKDDQPCTPSRLKRIERTESTLTFRNGEDSDDKQSH